MVAICGFIPFALLIAAAHCAPRLEDSPNENDVRSYFQKLEKKNQTLTTACNECKLIVSELKEAIKDPAKLNRLKVVLKLLCDYLGGGQAQDCKNMVDNLDFVIHELEPFLDDPEKFCKEIHLCGSIISAYSRLSFKVLKFFVRTASSNRTLDNDLLCDECVFATTEFNNMIHSPDIQQEVKRELEQVCKVWSKYQQQCNEAIEQYFPSFIQFIESITGDPKSFCTKIQLCGKSKAVSPHTIPTRSSTPSSVPMVSLRRAREGGPLRRLMLVTPLLQTRRGHNVLCIMCQFGFKSLIAEIQLKKAIISKEISDSVCRLLPGDLEADCLDFASIYASSLLEMLADEWTPGQICAGMQVCSNRTLSPFNALTEADRSSTLCEACHTFTEFIGYEFRQQSFQQQVTAMVKEEICNLLPGDLSHQCLDTADQYVPDIMKRLADYVSSATFCQELGMCSPTERLDVNN